jgi:hypothetical protein
MPSPRIPAEIVDTVATLKGRSGFITEHFVAVRDTGLTYRWEPNSTVTTNDREVIGHTGGVAGRFLPIGPFAGNAPEGAALVDGGETISVYQGFRRTLPLSTLTGTSVGTLGTVGAEKWAEVHILRLDAEAFTYAIANGGAGSGTLVTFASATPSWGVFYFDGTNWLVRATGVLI